MKQNFFFSRIPLVLGSALLAASIAVVAPRDAAAQNPERSGKEVVETVCASCHATGEKGAPRIGDKQAWGKRAAQGLSSLTDHALTGIRNMPSHGGDMKLTDLEIGRAVAYMVNQSGGNWVEPTSLRDMAAERNARQVVEAQCARCHKTGEGGAPKIGDHNAWRPRLTRGVDALVLSAIRGHGGMPPRGDKADLTDAELRNAILYMYNPTAPAKGAMAARAPAVPPGVHKVVGGLDIYLGFVAASKLRGYPAGSVERKMHGGVPAGRDQYHANVSVLDRTTKAPITTAKVELQVEQPGMSSETRTLEPVVINNAASYGSYVRMKPKTSYVVTVRVHNTDSPQPVEARFEHRQY
jgi:cytochrome c5